MILNNLKNENITTNVYHPEFSQPTREMESQLKREEGRNREKGKRVEKGETERRRQKE